MSQPRAFVTTVTVNGHSSTEVVCVDFPSGPSGSLELTFSIRNKAYRCIRQSASNFVTGPCSAVSGGAQLDFNITEQMSRYVREIREGAGHVRVSPQGELLAAEAQRWLATQRKGR